MISQKHCSEPKNGFGEENGGWCIGDALRYLYLLDDLIKEMFHLCKAICSMVSFLVNERCQQLRSFKQSLPSTSQKVT